MERPRVRHDINGNKEVLAKNHMDNFPAIRNPQSRDSPFHFPSLHQLRHCAHPLASHSGNRKNSLPPAGGEGCSSDEINRAEGRLAPLISLHLELASASEDPGWLWSGRCHRPQMVRHPRSGAKLPRAGSFGSPSGLLASHLPPFRPFLCPCCAFQFRSEAVPVRPSSLRRGR